MVFEIKKISFLVILFLLAKSTLFAQLDYTNMDNWAFHPDKSGTLIDGFNIDIAVIDKNLNTDSLIQIPNNSMINTGVDVFFVHPTILNDITGYTEREIIPIEDQPQFMIAASIVGQAGLLSQYGRLFAPRYQQASPPTFLSSSLDSTQIEILEIAYNDVKAAFQHYLEHHNNGNKFILASHSQGAHLTAMLLRDVFDNDENLREKLVVAIVAGIVSSYSLPNQVDGGWWQNIPRCTKIDQCGCVMTWRSYKEGQTLPFINPSLPALNPLAEDKNLVYRSLNLSNDRLFQDSIYYSTASQPLKFYTTPRANAPYGGNAGFVAFNDLYHIRYQRSGITRVGFMVEHTPQTNDQRPNPLQDEESNPLFNSMGYHNKDFNIYQWALLEQIDAKLAACKLTSIEKDVKNNEKSTLQFLQQPYSNQLSITLGGNPFSNELIKIYDLNGKLILETKTDFSGKLNITSIEGGMYILQTKNGSNKVFINK